MNDKIEKYVDFVVSDMILSTEIKYRNRRRRKFHIYPPYLNETTFISFHSGVVFKELDISDRMWFEKTFSQIMEYQRKEIFRLVFGKNIKKEL